MKKYCAVNTEYYRGSKAKSEIGHIERVFKVNKNVVESVYDNFGDVDIYDKYLDKIHEVERIKGKSLQKNSNTYIDQVLVFSAERVDYLIDKYGFEAFRAVFTKSIRKYQISVKQNYGFEPVGFKFHMDEGAVDPLTGEIKYNYHAHAIFVNFDFVKKKAPLRKMKNKDWCFHQDLLARAFLKSGFVRGVAKSQTRKKHLKKDEYIAKKQKEIIEGMNDAEEKLRFNNDLIDYNNSMLEAFGHDKRVESLDNRKRPKRLRP